MVSSCLRVIVMNHHNVNTSCTMHNYNHHGELRVGIGIRSGLRLNSHVPGMY